MKPSIGACALFGIAAQQFANKIHSTIPEKLSVSRREY
jgi:hypothetical protein